MSHEEEARPKGRSEVEDVTSRVSSVTRAALCGTAAGRCEFRGCNQFLFEHHLTLQQGNFSEVAHVVAFRQGGPRGLDGARPDDINAIGNLMLLCPQCHKNIDDHEDEFSRELLISFKSEHESRIRLVTDVPPTAKTVVVAIKAPVRDSTVDIPPHDIKRAVHPLYAHAREPFLIDLNALSGVGASLYECARRKIDVEIARLYEQGSPVYDSRNISVFALAPIPILVYLGSRMSNKIPLQLFQKHRDTQDWTWKRDGVRADFELTKLRDGSDRGAVGLILPLSGTIDRTQLPPDIRDNATLYEIRLRGRLPGTDFLRLAADLESFAATYRRFLSLVEANHRHVRTLHLFPAVPAPIAVLCGFERQPLVHPHLLVHSNDGPESGFVQAMLADDHGLE